MNRVVYALVALCWSMPASATDMAIKAAEITAFGTFEAGAEQHESLVRAEAPASDEVSDYRFVHFTNKIPARLGVEFGIEYVINSAPKGGAMQITHVIRYPGKGLAQPTGKTLKMSRERLKVRIGYPVLHGFGFDQASEIVPGDWVFEVWKNGTRLLRKKLTVMPGDSPKVTAKR